MKKSRTTSPTKEDKTTAPQEKYGERVGLQGSYSLEEGDPLNFLRRSDPLPKESKTAELQGEDGKCVGPQGSYNLEGGNPLNFFPDNFSSQ